MKLLAFIASITVSSALAAHAQSYTTQHLGNFDYTTGSNGYSGFGQHIGPFYYYHDNYGSGFAQTIGPFRYYNYTPNYRYDDGD